jgi:hypothetical protein
VIRVSRGVRADKLWTTGQRSKVRDWQPLGDDSATSHPALREHLRTHAQVGRNGLLFPADNGGHLAPATIYRHFSRHVRLLDGRT